MSESNQVSMLPDNGIEADAGQLGTERRNMNKHYGSSKNRPTNRSTGSRTAPGELVVMFKIEFYKSNRLIGCDG
jgi:hypothetical protein